MLTDWTSIRTPNGKVFYRVTHNMGVAVYDSSRTLRLGGKSTKIERATAAGLTAQIKKWGAFRGLRKMKGHDWNTYQKYCGETEVIALLGYEIEGSVTGEAPEYMDEAIPQLQAALARCVELGLVAKESKLGAVTVTNEGAWAWACVNHWGAGGF